MNTILGADGFSVESAAPTADLIKDGTQETFMQDVIEASRDVPVIVDFWAPWCGPCKQLTPALEAAVKAAGGKVRLVKINTDENQEIVGQLRVQSIPTVYGFRDGQPVDGFAGAQPDSQIKAFIDRLTDGAATAASAELDQALDQADQLLEAGNAEQAGALFQQILQVDNRNARAIAGMLRSLIATDQSDQADAILAQLPDEIARDPAILSVKAQMELAATPPVDTAVVDALKARIEKNAKDHEARIELADALFAAGEKETAADALLDSIAIDRAWNEEAARKRLLKLFEAMGPTDPVTQDARRRLSAILFS